MGDEGGGAGHEGQGGWEGVRGDEHNGKLKRAQCCRCVIRTVVALRLLAVHYVSLRTTRRGGVGGGGGGGGLGRRTRPKTIVA